MTVHVELFGIPRQRAGLKSIDVPAQTLGEMLRLLQQRLPQLAESCFENGHLKSGFLANINGKSFTTDLAAVLKEGDSVLILSADAGG